MLEKFEENLNKHTTDKEKEQYVLSYLEDRIYQNDFKSVSQVALNLKKVWELSVALYTKIMRTSFNMINITSENYEAVLEYLDQIIEFSRNNQTLQLDMEVKRLNVLLIIGRSAEIIEKVENLVKRLKNYEDHSNLIKVHMYESKAYYDLLYFEKAKSALTSARAVAEYINVDPKLQGQIDLLNGMYICDEKAYNSAISNFIEALDTFVYVKNYDQARSALRYILLCKILAGKNNELKTTINSKSGKIIKDDKMVKILLEISNVCVDKNIKDYKALLSSNVALIESDKFIYKHLERQFHILFDQNILKLIEPYSQVYIKFIAEKLGVDHVTIENKLRSMILDDIIDGSIDHVTQSLKLCPTRNPKNPNLIDNFKALKKHLETIENN